jgi:iduronate 2-sulfatase
LVESVDIYPTLAQLCGLKAPAGLVGKSFAPMLTNPTAPGKPAVFGFWRRGRGHSIRTPQYRLVEYIDRPKRARVEQMELYDLKRDPNETENIAAEHPEVVDELSDKLHAVVPLLQRQ